jgi:hypothetical protein
MRERVGVDALGGEQVPARVSASRLLPSRIAATAVI